MITNDVLGCLLSVGNLRRAVVLEASSLEYSGTSRVTFAAALLTGFESVALTSRATPEAFTAHLSLGSSARQR